MGKYLSLLRANAPAANDSGPTTTSPAAATPEPSRTHVDRRVRTEIERIEAAARALGWSAERLWEAHFWPGPRGLAAVMDPGDRIIELMPDWIMLRKPTGDQLRFMRMES